MRTFHILIICLVLITISSCSRKKHYDKGFSVSPETETTDEKEIDGISQDSIKILTRPSSVLLTSYPEFRLTTIYKLNYDKREDSYYTGSNSFYSNYTEIGHSEGNQWNYNFMPGLQAIYGFNLVNVSLKNVNTQSQKLLFEKLVLIKTLYIPSFTKDTLFNKSVKRDYYMISAYDEDSNNDGFINQKDLRRFYLFDLNGGNKENLVPLNYSVISSEYDCENDFMYVFAQLDENKNGQREETEKVHVFWIDLKNPKNNGRQYE
jgi:hypothetical protein